MPQAFANDALKHIAGLRQAVGASKTIEELEAAWDHFYLLESYVERTWPTERATIECCGRVKSGLSTYTRHVREGMPSPYGGWRVDLGALENKVRPQWGTDGYPLKGR